MQPRRARFAQVGWRRDLITGRQIGFLALPLVSIIGGRSVNQLRLQVTARGGGGGGRAASASAA